MFVSRYDVVLRFESKTDALVLVDHAKRVMRRQMKNPAPRRSRVSGGRVPWRAN
jgi:hypothetical protein